MFLNPHVTCQEDAILHNRSQDDKQVWPYYDRGNDCHAWFLGACMIPKLFFFPRMFVGGYTFACTRAYLDLFARMCGIMR